METARQILLYQNIGAKIRQKRNERKLNQADLAKRVGLTRTSIVNIEQGRQHPPVHLLWHIAESLGANIFDLIPEKLVTRPINSDEGLDSLQEVALQKGGSEAALKIEEFRTLVREHTSTSTPSKP